MNKKIVYIALAASVVGMSSCSKKLKEFQSDFFTTNPAPLEVVGQNVPATITGNIPAKFFVKNAKVAVTPVLVYAEGETQSGSVLLQGEKVLDNGQVVNYKEGGVVGIPFNVVYTPEMLESELYLDFSVDQKGKVYALPRVKVADGVLATATLASAETVDPAIANDKFQKVINEQHSTDIMFLVNKADIRKSETGKQEYADFNARLAAANADPKQEIAGVNINSFASPEGELDFNTALAEKREKSTISQVEGQLKKDNITAFGELTSSFTPEDWEGFRELVEKSDIQDKELIISVLSMYSDPVDREREIRNLSVVFDQLAEQILPQLRYSRIEASINVFSRTNEEIAEAYKTDVKQLSVEEILYLATLTDDNAKKMEIYNTACEVYPNDYRCFNNLGLTQFEDGDYQAAAANFNQAARLNPNSKEVAMNLGLISMLNKDWSKANEQLGAAAGVPEANDALGVFYLSQGDLNAAKRAFGGVKTNNAALAQILAKDYNAASNTLANVANPDATTYYLKAVIAARTNDEGAAKTNLRQAIALDNNYAARAKADKEFAKFDLSNL